MRKTLTIILVILASLKGMAQHFIQGSIQQGTSANKADITFQPNYSNSAGEYLSYISISIAIPITSATGVAPTITGTGNLAGVAFIPATPFSYTSGTEKIFSWICNNTTVFTMSWVTATPFTGASITFTGGIGTSKVRLVDFSNDGGGTNGNTLFSVVTNMSPFDVTNFSDFFYAIGGSNGSTKGNYPNGDFYIESNIAIAMGTCNPAPNAGSVIGTSPLCIGGTSTYTSNGDVGGTWSSSNTSVATINSSSGAVTALGTGSTDISYTISGCTTPSTASKTLIVNPDVNAGTVSGSSPLCIGVTSTYTSNGDAGGTWSSTQTSVALVNSSSGEVTTVGAGTTNITYTINNGCGSPMSSSQSLIVNATVTAGTVTGTSPLCIGSTATFTSNGTSGGTWSSDNTNIATVNTSTGLVTAVAAGSTGIVYTVSNGCGSPLSSSQSVTVNATVSAGIVNGATPLCIGGTTLYTSNGTQGGVWTSSNTSVATVDETSGAVKAAGAGTTNITYTVNTGCGSPVSSLKTLTVNPNVTAGTINGTSPLIVGATATYTKTGTAGGTWSSSNTSVATVNATSGLVSALHAGTADITYTVSTGCGAPSSNFKTLTVTEQPFIQGSIQQGTIPNSVDIVFLPNYNSGAGEYMNYTSISIAIPSASATGVTPTIVGTGNLSGVSFVQATPFSYTSGTEKIFSWICNNTTVFPMSWINDVQFTGATITFNGGTGTSKVRLVDFSNAGGGNNGNTLFSIVTNVAPFDVTNFSDFFYAIAGDNGSTEGSYGNGDKYVETNDAINLYPCNPAPNAGTVSGTTPICIGGTATYGSDGDEGGSWSSTNTSVATVNSSTGEVTAVAAGTTEITYTVSGCSGPESSSKVLTVTANVSAGTVSGTSPMCAGATTTYSSNGTIGGTWSSSNTSVAIVNATTGSVTAIGSGTTDIIYTINGCGGPVSSFQTLAVNAIVNAGVVSGITPLCMGTTTTYTSNGDAGGTWSSSNASVATVDASGLVTTIDAGTTDITYTINTGCGSPKSSSKILTVSPNPDAGTVSGVSSICGGITTTYTCNGDAGGSWISDNTDVASVNPTTGVVTGVGEGTATITYSVTTGCGTASASKTITVSGSATPAINCVEGGPFIRNASSACHYIVVGSEFDPTVTSSCGVATLSYIMSGVTTGSGTTMAGVQLNIGLTTIVWTATNGTLSSSCTTTITVVDNTSPTITCPGNIADIVNGKNKCDKKLRVPAPFVTDNCNISSLTWEMTGATTASSSVTGINYVGMRTFMVGVTTITYTVKDEAGNSSSCSFTITLNNPKCLNSISSRGNDIKEEIEDLKLEVKASPNPCSDYFQLHIKSGSNEPVTIIVYDIKGRKVEQLNPGSLQNIRLGESYINGMYLVEVLQGKKRATTKLIKQ